MRAAMRRNALYPGTLDPQFLLEEGDLVVLAVDLGLEPDLMILTEGRLGKQGCEGVVAESQDVENGRADSSLPATGQGQFGVHRGLRKNQRL
jgi:hypothetical protein